MVLSDWGDGSPHVPGSRHNHGSQPVGAPDRDHAANLADHSAHGL